LLPRARLSSASYALSLIGQSNIFPSTGTVGIGTQTPDANAQVHVKNGAGAGKITIEGPDGAEIVFKEGDNAASVSYDGDKINISNFNLVFNEGIKLPAGKTIRYNGEADWRLVDIDDFKNGNDEWICHYNWSDENVAPFGRFTPNTPFSRGYFLRPTSTGNSCLKKQFDLTGIPHTMVKVVFTYHFFDTWDYPEFAWAAFASQPNPYVQTGQSNGFFQLGWRKMSYAFNPRDAGYTDFVSTSRDTNVRGSMVAQTTLDKFWILFGSDLNSGANDESYGISDIEIWVR
jgi:hypothetical protein